MSPADRVTVLVVSASPESPTESELAVAEQVWISFDGLWPVEVHFVNEEGVDPDAMQPYAE